MLADFFTKPLQGNLFRRFRDVILGHSHVDTLQCDLAAQLEERVGENRSGACSTAPPGATPVNESRKSTKEKESRITWADIVKRGRVVNEGRGKDKNVSSALSRNNPVS
jgi:hypothetical protein